MIGAARLSAVPAVHFRLPFAEHVNRLCHDRSNRPDAIAVELGPETTAAAAGWLRELGARPEYRRFLPCMLGLARTNRLIRASRREAVELVQKLTGKNMNELPPELLRQAFGYSPVTILYLSPTDSIIEAIRCAIEWDLPLYGVDLEETAEAERAETMIEDPTLASGQVEQYVGRNSDYAESRRDEEVDHRREVAMAARLKSVLAAHRHVLFTGGLAHWRSLQQLLRDPTLRPAPVSTADAITPSGFQRVVVHPLLAIYHMDVFPEFTTDFQKHRMTPDEPDRLTEDLLEPCKYFEEMLRKVYKQHFIRGEVEEQMDRQLEDWEARPDFERMLWNLCALEQTVVPDLFTTLAVAQGTMSPGFCHRLADILMAFPWVTQEDFPNLPVLAPAPDPPGEYQRARYVNGDREHTGYFFVESNPGRSSYKVQVRVPWEWGGYKPPEIPRSEMVLSWPPIDYLMTAMSLRAMQLAKETRETTRAEVFQGSMCEGLDIKATLRAQSQGDERFYIRDSRVRRVKKAPPGENWEPVVWIFRLGRIPGSDWVIQGEEIREFIEESLVKDSARVRQARGELGETLVEQIGYGSRTENELGPGAKVDYYLDWQGMLLYAPSHFTRVHHSRWMENTGYSRNPIATYPGPYTYEGQRLHASHPLTHVFRQRYHLHLNLNDWPASMVRMAIPFAQTAITVVAPDHFRLPSLVFEEANRRQVRVGVVPHSYFPRDALNRISRWYATYPVAGTNGLQFPEEAERVFGEPAATNRNLVPSFWLNYGINSAER
jgi:hypothetical protein